MKTIRDLMQRARSAINRDEEIIYDVAAEYDQQVGNVKHMRWFLMAVAEEIIVTNSKYSHLNVEW